MRVLITDDNLVWKSLVDIWLSTTDIIYTIVDGPFEAVALLQTLMFDIVVVDLYMPNMSGGKLCDYIEKNYPNIKVIMVSVMDISELNKYKCKYKYVKPHEKNDFIEILETVYKNNLL